MWWIPIGIAVGIAGGYVIDKVFGDGEYTAREAVIDAATGVIGGAVLKPAAMVGGRAAKVIKYTADDVSQVAKLTGDDIVMIGGYVLTPAVSKPVQKEVIGGMAAGYVYDYFTAPGSSSSSYQQSGGPGDRSTYRFSFKSVDSLPVGTWMESPKWSVLSTHPYGGTKTGRHACKKGWVLAKVGGAATCIKFPPKSRI